MALIAEVDLKKDARNRVTLPAASLFEHYRACVFDDGHLELYPRVLTDPTIAVRTLHDMDLTMAQYSSGKVGKPVDGDALLAALNRPAKKRRR